MNRVMVLVITYYLWNSDDTDATYRPVIRGGGIDMRILEDSGKYTGMIRVSVKYISETVLNRGSRYLFV